MAIESKYSGIIMFVVKVIAPNIARLDLHHCWFAAMETEWTGQAF